MTIRAPDEAQRRGLRFIHQELNIVSRLSVAENIFLGRAYPSRFGLIDWRALNAKARAALATLGVDHIDPAVRVGRLSVGDRMLVKIAAAFLEDADASDPPRIFVMDEPTAALTGRESERLFRLIGVLRAAAAASSTSRTVSTRCCRSATASACCATARRAPPC